MQSKIKVKKVEVSKRKKRTSRCHTFFLSTKTGGIYYFPKRIKKLPVFIYDFLMASTILLSCLSDP